VLILGKLGHSVFKKFMLPQLASLLRADNGHQRQCLNSSTAIVVCPLLLTKGKRGKLAYSVKKINHTTTG
jgi:hypothetical protein